MIITDLDGTLFNSDKEISKRDLESISKIASTDNLTVVATGRNLHSALNTLPKDLPIDYLVFSCGCGIYDWKNQKLLHSFSLNGIELDKILKVINELELDYFIQGPIPMNHYAIGCVRENLEDFKSRVNAYANFIIEENRLISTLHIWGHAASQIILMYQGKDVEKIIEDLKIQLPNNTIIRATSPLDHQTHWIEIFPKNVSKSQGCQYLIDKFLKDSPKQTFALGNDYNDVDLLEWAKHGFVVSNAPQDLKRKFKVVNSHNEDGFTSFYQKVEKLSV